MTQNNEILTNCTKIEFPVSEETWNEYFGYAKKIEAKKHALFNNT